MRIDETVESDVATYTKAKLDNGLSVIVCCRPGTKSFAWRVSIKVGSKDGKQHLAHLVEHLTCENMTNVNLRSGYSNAGTDVENTDYFGVGHVDELNDAIESVAGIFQPLRAESKNVNEELQILKREDIERGGWQRSFNVAHSRVIAGDDMAKQYQSSKNKASLGAEDCNGFHQRHYRTANAQLAFVSPLSTKEALERIQSAIKTQYSDSMDRQNVQLANPRRVNPNRGRLISRPHAGTVTYCVWHVLDAENLEQRVCLRLANSILGGQGTLYESIRQKHQIAYGIYATIHQLDNRLCHSIMINLKGTKVKKMISLLAAELARISKFMPMDEYQLHVDNSCRNLELMEEDPDWLSSSLIRWNSAAEQAGKLVTPAQLRQTMRSISAESFAKWARGFFKSQNRDVYLAGGFGPLGWFAARQFAKGKAKRATMSRLSSP